MQEARKGAPISVFIYRMSRAEAILIHMVSAICLLLNYYHSLPCGVLPQPGGGRYWAMTTALLAGPRLNSELE